VGGTVQRRGEVCDLASQRLAPLGPETLALLAVAATIGAEFDVRILEAASGLSPEVVAARVGRAVQAGFVRASPCGGSRLEFVHAIVRETLYHDLALQGRAELHGAITRALEETYAERGERAPIEELAYQSYHAAALGDAGKAVGYALAAGDRAMAALAYEDAMGHYERALELAAPAQAGPALEMRARLGLGDAACRAGDHL